MKARHILPTILTFIGIALLAYYYVSGLPRYSFFLIGKAIKNHDVELFTRYVDVDAIVDEWVIWSSEKAKDELRNASGAADNQVSAGFVDLMMPTLRIKLKEEFKSTIMEGIENTGQDVWFSGLPLINIALLPIHKINTQGKVTTVEIIHPKNHEKIVFKLRQMPQRYWRLVSIQIPSLMRAKSTTPEQPKARQLKDRLPLDKEQPDKKLRLLELSKYERERDEMLNITLLYTEYYQKVLDKINQSVPAAYRKSGGKADLKIVISSDGKIKDVKIMDEKSSPDPKTREMALAAARDASPFPAFPKGLESPELEFEIPVPSDAQ